MNEGEFAPRQAGPVRQEYTSDNKHLVVVRKIKGENDETLGGILIKARTKPQTVSDLIQALQDQDADVRGRAAFALREVGTKH